MFVRLLVFFFFFKFQISGGQFVARCVRLVNIDIDGDEQKNNFLLM